jgi:hypothetical protein
MRIRRVCARDIVRDFAFHPCEKSLRGGVTRPSCSSNWIPQTYILAMVQRNSFMAKACGKSKLPSEKTPREAHLHRFDVSYSFAKISDFYVLHLCPYDTLLKRWERLGDFRDGFLPCTNITRSAFRSCTIPETANQMPLSRPKYLNPRFAVSDAMKTGKRNCRNRT